MPLSWPGSPGLRYWAGVALGGDQRGYCAAGVEQAVLVLGPPRSGKTSAIVVPAVLEAPAAVVSTSTKPDVLAVTGRYRVRCGPCFVFDPTGEVALPPWAEPVRWSPVSGCQSFERAVLAAHSLASAARPGAALSEAAHWVERAEALLAPLFHAAAIGGLDMAAVCRWVLGHELAEPADVLAEAGAPMAGVVLSGVLRTEERERSGILSTAAGLLAPYRSEAALRAACSPTFDPAWFAASCGTLYVCAPAHAQEQLAPLIVTLLDQVRAAVYARPPDAAPVLFALDEVAQIAPLPALPQMAAEGGGQGLVTLACLQDLSQAYWRWGPAAEGFFSLFSAKVVFPGIGDRRTLELLSLLAGEQVVTMRSVTRSKDSWVEVLSGRGHVSSTTSTQSWRPRLTVDEAARGRPGQVLVVTSHPRPDVFYLAARPWWEIERWRDELARTAGRR